ncbi:MAG: long-chain-acyl-CoA synthetase [Alphaproteobacteria bacterium]|nr:long-chain-acyl-CoA synthetase [Alphaproteobacteria bacterium]
MGIIQDIGREYAFISGVFRAVRRLGNLTAQSKKTSADVIEHWVRVRPGNTAIVFEDVSYTYLELDRAANRYARWALAQGIGQGDTVALLMENRPEFLFAWFGLHKIGAAAALINTHLQGQPLAHSLQISGAKHLILGAECAEHVLYALERLEEKPLIWSTGARLQGTEDLDTALSAMSDEPLPPDSRAALTAGDKALLIYTSGTTGLPKAANISHLRMQNMMQAFGAATNSNEKDRVYVALPLYHSAGGICAVGMAFSGGGTIVLRRKFSASHFWEDCARYKPTIFQYIGELCRYLLNTPPHPLEQSHSLRVIIGNGLRPEVWKPFQERFKIPKIIEFYGATEGNIALLNIDGTQGAVGRIPSYLRRAMPTRIVKFDIETEQPVRDPVSGFCIECAPGEAGEAIGQITQQARTRFEGYTKSADSEKKILRDVFEKGDMWFRSGDLLRRDAKGYFYFVDRIGDTFRWKGENVATSEVSEVLSVVPGVCEANVYGVTIPGTDGRAGMAAIVTNGEFDLNAFYAHVEAQLPTYARPLFLRITKSMDITGTFKHRKVEFVKEGFNPASVPDPLFLRDDVRRSYRPLDVATFEAVIAGELKF